MPTVLFDLLGLLAVPLLVALGVAGWYSWRKAQESDRFVPRKPGTLTFNKDVAPIFFATSRARRVASRSSMASGWTMTRISRPACKA